MFWVFKEKKSIFWKKFPSPKRSLTENSPTVFKDEVQTGCTIDFSIFPDLIKRSFKTIGWECLVEFFEPLVYTDLVKQFYSTILVGINESGEKKIHNLG